jgi:D-alanyl-lipoteichoic acid acyltransferase DltB (MBOAT superfamily)
MLFTSLGFFGFLAVALVVFALLPARARWAWLLAASGFFYGASNPQNLAYLGGITLVVWGCGAGMARSAGEGARRMWLAGGLAIVLGSLVALKFYFTGPAGYSFYVFSAASYLIDSFSRRLSSAQHLGETALYLAWFPKILAGPIERAPAFLPRLRAAQRATPGQLVLGAQLIGWGLFKKVVIADNLAPLVDRTFGIAAYASPVDLLVSVYFFAFQIYCDFSGYTDIAIGVSLLFGLELMENFRRPYLSRSTAEFWGERWHISLGRWFRDYLYIPLGGSRAGTARRMLNVMLVFIASGLWHAGLGYGVGWTFLVWGALNGGYQVAGLVTRPLWTRLGDRLPRLAASVPWTVLRVLFTFHLIAISWIFFRAKSLGDAWLVLRRIATQLTELPALVTRYPFTPDHLLGFALIALLLVVELFDERKPIYQRLAEAPVALRWGACYLAIFGLLLVGRWQPREFIYMQF